MLVRLRRTAVLLASTATVAALSAGVSGPAAASAAADTDTPVHFPAQPQGLAAPVDQPRQVEAAAGWSPQASCSPVPMRGVRKLRDLALQTYGQGYDGGMSRSCVVGGSSEHKEGRAWDWMLNVNNRAQRRAAGDFLAWLTKPGRDGVPGVQARRLGIMYVIYNRKIWRSYRPGWEAYSGYSPHTDHIHISFSWAGARGRTSFWTGRVAGPDYGPCPVFAGQPARLPGKRANPAPCADPVALVKRSSRPTVQYGASGLQAVRFAQRRLGLDVTGRFDHAMWRAVRRYQRAYGLPVTGVLDTPTWSSLAPRSVRWDVTEGYTRARAAGYAHTNFSATRLRRGSAGAPVAFLQKALGVPRAHRNGLLVRHTAEAVRDFKAAHGLARNAVLTPATWAAVAGLTS